MYAAVGIGGGYHADSQSLEYIASSKPIEEKIKLQMETTSIKNTKLYWLLKRCLVEESKNRSILFI